MDETKSFPVSENVRTGIKLNKVEKMGKEYFGRGVHATSHRTHKKRGRKKLSSCGLLKLLCDPAGRDLERF